jgi:hypothetical protein
MSYHRFNNLQELFQGHLNKVLLRNVDSEDLRDRPCTAQVVGLAATTMFAARHSLLIRVRFRKLGSITSVQTLKKRAAGHLQDTRKLLRVRVRSSALASHLAQMGQRNSNSIPSAGMLRDELTYSILW